MTDQQPPRVTEETITMKDMAPLEAEAMRACIAALGCLPFPVAMTVLANILCACCLAQGVRGETVMKLVSRIWDAMTVLETAPKERV